jgi:hypothetical protein
MSRDTRLADLARLAGLLRDQRLDRLRRAAADHAEAEADLAALVAPEPMDADAAAALAAVRDRWHAAEARRRSIRLARARSALIEARADAAREVGRADVLARLASRPPPRPGGDP